MKNIYYIGGSPCSGKSTIAQILSAKYNLYYFKADDYLEQYAKSGDLKGYKICRKQCSMSAEEIWMREPVLQCEEELMFYREIFEFIQKELRRLADMQHGSILTEGAAYLPELMEKINISKNRYLSIIPSSEFQVSHYRKREWISSVLEGCQDKEAAFSNWMKRDIMFAKEVQKQCERGNFKYIINDGSMRTDELARRTAAYFGLRN